MWKTIKYWNGWRFIGWGILALIILLFICTGYFVDLPELFPKVLNIVKEYPNTAQSILLSLLVIIPFIISEAHDFRKFLQRPSLFFNKKGKCEPLKNDIDRLFIEIKNNPKLRAEDGSSTARFVRAEVIIKRLNGKEITRFHDIRWSGTSAPTILDHITQQPADYFEKTIRANAQPVNLYILAKNRNTKDIYFHNARSYIPKTQKFNLNEEQKLENKKHIIEISLEGENTENYLLELILQPKGKNLPKLTIQNCYLLKGKNKDVKLTHNELIEGLNG